MRGHSATLLLVAASTFACTTDRDARSAGMYDSAGVQIVVSPDVSSLTPAFRLDAQPTVSLGGIRERTEEEFDSRHPWLSALVLDDGTIVVNDATQLKFFDSAGVFLRSVGRAGQGPGEFGSIREVCRTRGDTLIAIDYTSPRLSVYSPEGTFVASVAVLGHVPLGPCLGDGRFLVQRRAPASDADGGPLPGITLYHIRMDGSEAGEITRAPASSYGLVTREVSTIAVGHEVVIADGERYELRVYSPEGELTRIIRSSTMPRPVTDSDWNRAAEGMVPMQVVGPQRAAQLATVKAAPRPTHYSAYGFVKSDPLRRLWVQDYAGSPRSWTVFSVEGRALGRFTPPAELGELVAVGRNHVVFRLPDADGAPQLLIHRLLEP